MLPLLKVKDGKLSLVAVQATPEGVTVEERRVLSAQTGCDAQGRLQVDLLYGPPFDEGAEPEVTCERLVGVEAAAVLALWREL